ncbi:MAG: FAD-dependent oxidoreductase [Pseudomonadales bacterium]|nr:FAD-dependent oxidoreductase [Pseudomonadales bacterium]
MLQTVAIVGAGVMGRLLALKLLQQGFKVSVYDREARHSSHTCSFVGAGMLTPYTEAESAEPLVHELGLEAFDCWQNLCQQFSPTSFRIGGSLIVAHPNDQADLQRFEQNLRFNLQPEHQLALQQVDQVAIDQLEPDLGGRFQQGVYLAAESWLVSETILKAMADELDQNARFSWYDNVEISDIMPGQISVSGKIEKFDWVLDCRGLGAKQDIPGLRGVRGELLWLHAPEVKLNRLIRLMHPRYQIYVIPRPNDVYIIGATQIESEDYSDITVRSALELLSAAYTVHRGFGEASVVKTATHCRPAMPDNLPVVICQAGLIRVNGLFRHGYLLSPAISSRVVEFMQAGNLDSRFMQRLDDQVAPAPAASSRR